MVVLETANTELILPCAENISVARIAGNDNRPPLEEILPRILNDRAAGGDR